MRAHVSIRQHTSAYARIRQYTSAYVGIRQHTSAAYGSIRPHTSACIRQHTSAYVSIRQHPSAYVCVSASAHLVPRVCPRLLQVRAHPSTYAFCRFPLFSLFLGLLARSLGLFFLLFFRFLLFFLFGATLHTAGESATPHSVWA